METQRLEALKAGKTLEFAVNKMPKCPHCGEVYDIGRNDAWQLYDDNDSHEVDCPSCELSFRVVSHAVWTFSTDDQG
jgi:hypothetical protein